MFTTIIWATDGSEDADRALPYAKELARREGARLVAVHVEETYATHIAEGLPLRADEAELRAKVEGQVAALVADGIQAEAQMLVARAPGPAHLIAEVAASLRADLIVAGTRGHTRIPGMVLGSVTHRLLQLAPCPLMAIPLMRTRGEPKERHSRAVAA